MSEFNETLPLDGGARKRLAVYTIVERGGPSGGLTPSDKKWWVRIGTAFFNKDQSLNVLLDAMPTNGTLHIREVEPRDERSPRRQ